MGPLLMVLLTWPLIWITLYRQGSLVDRKGGNPLLGDEDFLNAAFKRTEWNAVVNMQTRFKLVLYWSRY